MELMLTLIAVSGGGVLIVYPSSVVLLAVIVSEVNKA